MSRENVEIVRRAMTAATRRPRPDFATVNALFDPDHELISIISAVEGRGFHGAHGFREWLLDMNETWESWESRIVRVEPIDDERVLAVMATSARSKGGVQLEQESWFIATVRDGRLVRTESYRSLEMALQAAGLEG